MALNEYMVSIIVPAVAVMSIGGLGAWFSLERLKIQKGYPLESMWGRALHPKVADEQVTTLKADLDRKTAQITRLEERVQTLERILTDRSSNLSAEIDRLRS
jgi:hypothetical protein